MNSEGGDPADIESQPHEAAPGAMQLGTTESGQPKRKDAPPERAREANGEHWLQLGKSNAIMVSGDTAYVD